METPKPIHEELHRIAVTGVVWREEAGVRKYLITKRSPTKKVWPNKWTIPGGGLEVNDYYGSDNVVYQNSESPQWYHVLERTLRREVKEEVGLDVDDIAYFHDVAFIRPDGVPVVVVTFSCQAHAGEVTLDEDATEYAWISAKEAGSYDFIQGIDKEIMGVEERLAKKG